jgi:hypothetical protein
VFRGNSFLVLILAGCVYGLAPVFVTLGLRQRPPSAALSLILASLGALLWASAAVLFATRLSTSLNSVAIIVAPVASALWLIVFSVEVRRAVPRRTLRIALSILVGVLIINGAFAPVFPFPRELIAVAWAIWMFDTHRALGSRVMRTRGAWLLMTLGVLAVTLFVAVQLYIAAFMRGCTVSYC